MSAKVIYLIDTLEVGGAEKSLLEILRRTRNIEPVVCSIYAGDALSDSFEKNGIRTVSFGLKGKYRYATAIRKMLGLIRKEKAQLLHTILARSHFVGRAAGKLAGIPVISTFVNDSYSSQRYERLTWGLQLKLRGTQLLDRITARWALHFIANSENIKNSVCRSLGISEAKVSVIHRGRDPSVLLNPDSDLISELQASLSLSKEVPTILNVGRLILQKAQKDLVLAMDLVRKESPARLLIAGEGPCRSNLTELIDKLKLADCISLLGNRHDVPALLQLSAIFVFPSYYEGHPGSLLEAMFAGCPIVASDISVHRETLRDKETGLLVPVEDPRAISDAILWMLRHPQGAHHMAEQAREVAMNRFHIDQIADLHEQVSMEVLDRWKKTRAVS